MMDKKHPFWYPCMLLLRAKGELEHEISVINDHTPKTDVDEANLVYCWKRLDQVTVALVLLGGGTSQR